jgi:membrane protease YdiL (CAAX protease family)
VESGWYFHPTVLSLCMAIVAGFGEEVMFRGLLVPIGMGFLKKHRVFLTVFTSSVIFGAMHLFNAGSGAGMTLAILQAVATTFVGVFLAAIYLRSGSILVPIVLHGVYDWICFVTDPTLDNGIMTGDVTLGVVLAVLIDIALGIAAIYLLRPAVNGEIEALWDAKWGKTGED